MDETSTTAASQSLVDAKAYPPTHAYDIGALKPRGVLADRVRTILDLCPGFFQARRFLDVGCSKGFFALAAAQASLEVVAIDPDPEALASWDAVRPEHVTVLLGTFAQIDPVVHGRFDMIWIGNGHHYLQREDPRWPERLLELAADRVVIEGPVGRACADVAGWPDVMEESTLVQALRPMVLVGRAASPSYTPDRAVWCFRMP